MSCIRTITSLSNVQLVIIQDICILYAVFKVRKIYVGAHLLSHTVSSIVSSAAQVLTIVFGMGTGVTPGRISTNNL